MPYKYRAKTYLIVIIIMGLISPVWGNDTDQPEPMVLRKIMQVMSKDMQAVTDAISREQWHKVATIAPEIGNHPQPPFIEKTRILRFVGSDANTFRAYDKNTQHIALTLKQAAIANDANAVILSFAELQKSCFSCHQRFREAFVVHFYGQH